MKKKLKYAEEFPLDHYMEKMSKEVGTSMVKFISVVNREFNEIRLRGFEFSHISIDFIINQSGQHSVIVKIWSTLDGSIETQYGPKKTDERLFVNITYREAMKSVFFQIFFWKEHLIKAHSDKIRKQSLKQHQLFPND